ncbi:hypothetical protein L8106_08636 [Lyngbya sp. PCC 8106]|nr:hypothetical protein L8106_08636 [Lyngbya sp. PCC 8106]
MRGCLRGFPAQFIRPVPTLTLRVQRGAYSSPNPSQAKVMQKHHSALTEKIGIQAPSVIDGFMLNFLLWKG